MIDQLLRRAFVDEQSLDVQAQLAAAREHALDLPTIDGETPSAVDVAAALEALEAIDAARADPADDEGFAPPAGVQAPSLEERAFVARDAATSVLQSALERRIVEAHPDLIEVREAGGHGRRRGAGSAPPVITDRVLRGVEPGRPARRLLNQFSGTDVRWVSSLVALGLRKVRGRHPWPAQPAAPMTIADDARILLVGDWGSGVPRARSVADEMRQVLLDGRREGREQHVIHLGDVYYSGFGWEYAERFLPWWPVWQGEEEAITSWSLIGNHDMYSGGYGYFDSLLTEPRFARQEGSSRFSLHTSHWDILGLDTSWDEHGAHDPRTEHGLPGDQDAWVADHAGKGRKLMLLSHHQPMSAYGHVGPILDEKLGPVLHGAGVDVWFWGHEHRCMTFAEHAGIRFGRCIGHGGVPVYMWHDEQDAVPAPGVREYRAYLRHGLERWARMGFAIVDLDGGALEVEYVDDAGTHHWPERFDG